MEEKPCPAGNNQPVIEHELRLHFLEDWRSETMPVIKDLITVQAKQSANISNITRLFWLVLP